MRQALILAVSQLSAIRKRCFTYKVFLKIITRKSLEHEDGDPNIFKVLYLRARHLTREGRYSARLEMNLFPSVDGWIFWTLLLCCAQAEISCPLLLKLPSTPRFPAKLSKLQLKFTWSKPRKSSLDQRSWMLVLMRAYWSCVFSIYWTWLLF